MLKTRRICVPLSLDCNLHCRYCFRDPGNIKTIPNFTYDMIQYLNNLDPSWCEAVVASGGEPLLHWDKVLELFSYVPQNVHKCILTNGTLLTEDKIEYINENNIEISLSYDGKMTEFLRGVDVFNNEKLLSLIRQIKILRIFSVVTSYNNDIWENFFYTISKLDREYVYYETFAMGITNANQKYLLDNFDYILFGKTLLEFRNSHYYILNPYRMGRSLIDDPELGSKICGGLDILPNGIAYAITNYYTNYGSIYNDNYQEIYNQAVKLGIRDTCLDCKLNNICSNIAFISEHTCLVKKNLLAIQLTDEKFMERICHIEDVLPEIEAKYGYIRKK